jgi:hypothetical protein
VDGALQRFAASGSSPGVTLSQRVWHHAGGRAGPGLDGFFAAGPAAGGAGPFGGLGG